MAWVDVNCGNIGCHPPRDEKLLVENKILREALEEIKQVGLSAHGKSTEEMIFTLGLVTGKAVKALEEEV